METRIETGFEKEEFLEGSKDAFYMVTKLGNTHEYKDLKPMMSDTLYQASRIIFEEYKAKSLSYIPRIDMSKGDIQARICGIQFLDSSDMEKHTADALSAQVENPDSELAGKWLVLAVEFKTTCIVEVHGREHGRGVDGAKTEEATLSTVVDSSPRIWKFFTGPLPNGLPVRYLDTPWRVLWYV